MDDPGQSGRLSQAECVRYLERSSPGMGRIALSIRALPTIVPVGYSFADGGLLFRVARDARLDEIVAGAVVAFEAGDYGPDGSNGWTVLVQGRAEALDDPPTRRDGRGTTSAEADGEAHGLFHMELAVITGERFRLEGSTTTSRGSDAIPTLKPLGGTEGHTSAPSSAG